MENNKEIKTKTGLSYGRGYVYFLQYHLVWCTKYRRKVLVDRVEEDLKSYLGVLSEEYDFIIDAMEIMPDHVHLLVTCKPQFELPRMIKILKGNTARWLFMAHPEIKKKLWDGHLWNPSYCVVTVSDRSFSQVKEYINLQKVK